MLEPLRALRGPTIRALLRRMGVVAAVLVAALVAVRVAGQQISADRYHQAAIDEVDRIEPALRLKETLNDAQAALQSYLGSLEGDYRTLWFNAYQRFLYEELPRAVAANR